MALEKIEPKAISLKARAGISAQNAFSCACYEGASKLTPGIKLMYRVINFVLRSFQHESLSFSIVSRASPFAGQQY